MYQMFQYEEWSPLVRKHTVYRRLTRQKRKHMQ